MAELYKYIADPGAASFLLRGTLKFTPIAELNDPSELLPNVIENQVRDSLARLRRVGYSDDDMVDLRRQGALFQRLAPEHQVIDVPSAKEDATAIIRAPFYDQIDILVLRLKEAAREMSSKVGVLCLSRRYDSLPMWAHYASNGTGLIVHFEGLEEVFVGDETGVLRVPRAVRYERERTGVTFDPRSHESLFFTKFSDWSYEQEVRVVLPLHECRRLETTTGVLHLLDVPATCVRRLILGWNMPRERIEEIRACVHTENPDVQVSVARFDGGQVALDSVRPHVN